MKKPLDETAPLTKGYSYLALGDSYTIGEQVEEKYNFPNQVITILKDKGVVFDTPEIIARTGWTTDELQAAIHTAQPGKTYDLVTLLIGVNDQYRGRKTADYIPGFESLLKQAIQFAGNDPAHVVVLSIPDWGATPFAEGRDRKRIASEIDDYNAINEAIAKKYNIYYINVTESTRQAAADNSLLTSDGLHPSGKEYAKWAKKVAEFIQEKM